MKNLVFGLIATVLFALNANAQEVKSTGEPTESAFMTVKSGEELIKYKFNSVKDFEENTDKILDEIAANGDTNRGNACEVTIEVSITVTTGTVSTTVSASVTTSCANAAAAVKRLRAQLIAAVTG